MNGKCATILNPHGHLLIDGPGGRREHDTLQCCHCGRHFVVITGSGRRRGFCARCAQVTCGAPGCANCLPYERRIELLETS